MAYAVSNDCPTIHLDYDAMIVADRLDANLPAYSRSGTVYWFGPDNIMVPYGTDRPVCNFEPTLGMPEGMYFNSAALQNDVLDWRDLTTANWVHAVEGEITVTKTGTRGADGVADAGNLLTFNGMQGSTSLAVTGGVSGTGSVVRLTVVGHGLPEGRFVLIAMPTTTLSSPPTQAQLDQNAFATAANGWWGAHVVDADTIELTGSTFGGVFTSNGTLNKFLRRATAGSAGTNGIRLTITQHQLPAGRTLSWSFPAGTFGTAINGWHTIDVIDADTVEVRGTTMAGSFAAGNGSPVMSFIQPITDATSRARVGQFLSKYNYLSNAINSSATPGSLRFTMDNGRTWASFQGSLPRHKWQMQTAIFSTALGTSNQKNPGVGFACDQANTSILVDMVMNVRNTCIPTPFFTGTMNVGAGDQSVAGKLVKKTGSMACEFVHQSSSRDRMASNYTVVKVGEVKFDASNYAAILMDTPTTGEENRFQMRYVRAGATQADIKVGGATITGTISAGLKPYRVDPVLFTWGANDCRAYGWVDGSGTTNKRGTDDTTVTVWASDGSGSFVFGDFCWISRARLYDVQIAT